LYVVVVALSGVIGWAIATAFFAVFSMTIDTILLCFLEDIERHGEKGKGDDIPGKQYYASPELQEFITASEKHQGGGCCGCCC